MSERAVDACCVCHVAGAALWWRRIRTFSDAICLSIGGPAERVLQGPRWVSKRVDARGELCPRSWKRVTEASQPGRINGRWLSYQLPVIVVMRCRSRRDSGVLQNDALFLFKLLPERALELEHARGCFGMSQSWTFAVWRTSGLDL